MHLAELNIGRLIAPVGDPCVAEFIDNIDRINNLGKRMPGFVWMMEGDDSPGNTEHAIDGDPLLIPNLSVWESGEALRRFVYHTVHDTFLARRTEWFEHSQLPTFVMWWIAEGIQPTLEQALARLDMRRASGDTDQAFGWDYLSTHPHPAQQR